ncbi:MAG: trypsin-like serine protease, partial [Planctomycetota bacterium]
GSRNYASQFDSVVALAFGSPFCTATLIAPNVVISARHCGGQAGDQVRFGTNANSPVFTAFVQSSILPDGGGSLLDGGDVAILILTGNVPNNVATPSPLVDATSTLVDQVAATIGYGFNGVGSAGHQFTSDNQRWGGENVIDAYGSPVGSGGSNILSTDFDNGSGGANTIPGSSAAPLQFEATTSPGDSGGPLMVTVGGELAIAGVLSGGSTSTSVYGDISWWTGTADFRMQIEAAGGQFTDGTGGPPNDDWNDKIAITSLPGSVGGSSVNATTQQDEQDLSETGATVWWCVTAPSDGIMTIDTFGSNFDTQLQVYVGGESGFSNLQSVAANNDGLGDPQSLIAFPVSGGQRYDIRVGGNSSSGTADQGAIQLSVAFMAEGPTDFFWSDRDLNSGAVNTSNAEASYTVGSSGSVYLYYDPLLSDVDTGAFFDIVTSQTGVIEITNAVSLDFDIEVTDVPFSVRWGDAFGDLGIVTPNSVDEMGALTIVSGTGMLAENTGPTFFDQGYDSSVGGFQFARIDFNVVGPAGSSVDLLLTPGETGIVNDGVLLEPGLGSITITVSEELPPETDFFWSTAALGQGASNSSMAMIPASQGESGSIFLYYDTMTSEVDTGIFLDISTSIPGVIEFTNAESFDFDILAAGVPFSVRWGDAFGELGDVTPNFIDEFGAFSVVGGTGILNQNTGPTFLDEGYDPMADAFLFGRVDYTVVGAVGDVVDITATAGDLGIVNAGMLVDSTIGMASIVVTDFLLGDVNCDGVVDLLDVAPFVDLLSTSGFSPKADINQDGIVDLLDVGPFVDLLSGA